MYCKCGNRIDGQNKYTDYCKECNKVIQQTLDDIMPELKEIGAYDSNSSYKE